MKEEGISSSCDPLLLLKSSSPPPTPTPAASSAGASSPAFAVNVGSTDGLLQGQSSKGGSRLSQPAWASLTTSPGGSALGSSQPSCRPWERGDLLQRLSTFTPSSWFGKPKAANSLACARRGWVNVNVDKLECESCGANLQFVSSSMWTPVEANSAGEEFSKKLEEGHKSTCPWRGNSCAESLVQFPPTPPSALVGGFKDRSYGLLQFSFLPIVTASAIEQMRASRGAEIGHFLAQSHALAGDESDFRSEMPGTSNGREDVFLTYFHAQKLISLCGWEPRWLPNIQDCEEHSAQSARNGCSMGPKKYSTPPKDPSHGKKALSTTKKKNSGKNDIRSWNFKGESRSPLLDCTLCGATVRILDFLTVSRPDCFAPNSMDIPETSKKLGFTCGVSAASGISARVAADRLEKEHIEDHDGAATADEGKSSLNVGTNLSLTMAGALSTMNARSERYQDLHRGKGIVIGQPSSSEVGNRAASYESRSPSSRKRNLDEGGSTVDRPQIATELADSMEGTVIDRNGDEVDDSRQYSAGPSKRAHEAEGFESHKLLLHGGPSQSFGIEIGIGTPKDDFFDQGLGGHSTRDSTHVSSVVAMDTVNHGADADSMESVENYPGDMDDVHAPSTSTYRYTDPNETSELNCNAQAQQSACPAAERNTGEMGISSINDEEVLNADTAATQGRDGLSYAFSGGSVGMGASQEAEIHGTDASVHRGESVVGDVEPVAEVTENQGQTGEFAPDPGLMGDYVPEEMDREDPHRDNQDIMSQSVGGADSGSKIIGLKAESVESGEKTSNFQSVPDVKSAHPSLSCNAVVDSGYEVSKDEVTQAEKALPADDPGFAESGYLAVNTTGPPNGESNYEEAVEFDPIKYHNYFCPWVNGNVAAAGCSSSNSSGSSSTTLALCGWQLTLDAFQSLGQVLVQTLESESAASLYKDDHLTDGRKLLTRHSFNKSRGQS